MPYVKISELPAATTPLAGTELLEIVQGGTSKSVAASELAGDGGGTATADPTIGVVTVSGTAHTLEAADNGKRILFNSASECTLTLPQQSTTTLPGGFNVLARNRGGGALSLAVQGSDVVIGGTSWATPAEYAAVVLDVEGSPNTWASVGDLS